MKRVTGIGGIFFKARDRAALAAWYQKHLGVPVTEHGFAVFEWKGPGMTVWNAFAHDTTYFAPSDAPFMINYRVEDLHALLAALRAEGVTVDDKVEESEFGKFGLVLDPEDNRVELWEPPPEK